jgi:hypothetical protein
MRRVSEHGVVFHLGTTPPCVCTDPHAPRPQANRAAGGIAATKDALVARPLDG